MYMQEANVAFRFGNSMNAMDSEILYTKCTWKEQTVRAACGTQCIPMSLNYFKIKLQ